MVTMNKPLVLKQLYPGEPVGINKTKLQNQQANAKKNLISKVERGINNLTVNQAEELKRVLVEEGLDLRVLIRRLKDIALNKEAEIKGSDVVKVLERLLQLHGVEESQAPVESKVSLLFQSKSLDDVKSFLMEITQKTTNYLDKMKAKEEPQE